MNGDLPLWLIVLSFVVWEVYAHFVAKNMGEHTLSNRIKTLEDAHPWTRLVTLVTMVALTIHLLGGF